MSEPSAHTPAAVSATSPVMVAARHQPSFASATGRIFALAFPHMLWSRRTLLLVLMLAAPILLAVVARIAQANGLTPLRINGERVSGAGVFGMMMWVLFLRFLVPVLAVFYGTALIADEVEDKTITFLFTRPVRRAAVLVGKYFAYLACTTLIVLPVVTIVYFLLVPIGEMAASFPAFLADLGLLGLGLAVYGALFALGGALLKRPLVSGLVFAFGWEPGVMVLPGYLRRLTVGYYLQGLVPHAMPADDSVSILQVVIGDVPSAAMCLLVLAMTGILCLWAAGRAVERREYVLEQ